MKPVTPRQMQVLECIRDYRMQCGYSPTMQEIGDYLFLTRVTVFEHIVALEKKGLVLRGKKHKARSLELSNEVEFPEDRPACLPIAGQIVAGAPVEALENLDILDLGQLFLSTYSTFVLQVTGESMIDDQIRPGDYVICEGRDSVIDGQIVVALLDDGETTLKRYYREKNRIRLQPANSNFKPIFRQHVQIQGVVIGVVRRL